MRGALAESDERGRSVERAGLVSGPPAGGRVEGAWGGGVGALEHYFSTQEATLGLKQGGFFLCLNPDLRTDLEIGASFRGKGSASSTLIRPRKKRRRRRQAAEWLYLTDETGSEGADLAHTCGPCHQVNPPPALQGALARRRETSKDARTHTFSPRPAATPLRREGKRARRTPTPRGSEPSTFRCQGGHANR